MKICGNNSGIENLQVLLREPWTGRGPQIITDIIIEIIMEIITVIIETSSEAYELLTPTWLARPLSPGRVLEVDVALEVAEKALAICVVTSWFLYVRRVVRAETRRCHEK